MQGSTVYKKKSTYYTQVFFLSHNSTIMAFFWILILGLLYKLGRFEMLYQLFLHTNALKEADCFTSMPKLMVKGERLSNE